MNKIFVTILVVCSTCADTDAQTGPGGVGNNLSNKLWFDAGSFTGLSDGAVIATWSDRSGNDWSAGQTSTVNKPTFFTNQLNGKAVIRFNRTAGNQYLEITSTGVGDLFSNSNTIFVVAKANSGALNSGSNHIQSLIAAAGSTRSTVAFFGYPTNQGVYLNNYLTGSTTSIDVTYATSPASWQVISRLLTENMNGTTIRGYVSGVNAGFEVSTLQMANYSNMARIGVGNPTGYSYPLNGDIAEIIAYNATLNNTQRIIVENYLSAKYNLPIATDKYQLNDATYTQDVQGIGTADGVADKHSAASNCKGLQLDETNLSLNAAGEYLFAGHATTTNSVVTSDINSVTTARWERSWYIEKTGQIDAMLTFDFSDAGIAEPPSLNLTQFKLLYRSTPSGAFSILPVVATSGGTDKIQFALSNVQLQNGYYTVGYSNGILWTGQQNSQWDLPANWSSNSVPTSADLVIIENCSTCPELSASVVVAGAAISGSSLTLENQLLPLRGQFQS
jgi:hypothetical protein